MKRNARPTHPGEYVREILEAEGMTQGALAARLQVDRQTVNKLVKQRSGVSPEMACRLARLTKTEAQVWLGLQVAVDLYDLEHSERFENLNQILPLENASQSVA